MTDFFSTEPRLPVSFQNAAVYARHSTVMQLPSSIDDQLRSCQKYADQVGWRSYTIMSISTRRSRGPRQMISAGLARIIADHILATDAGKSIQGSVTSQLRSTRTRREHHGTAVWN